MERVGQEGDGGLVLLRQQSHTECGVMVGAMLTGVSPDAARAMASVVAPGWESIGLHTPDLWRLLEGLGPWGWGVGAPPDRPSLREWVGRCEREGVEARMAVLVREEAAGWGHWIILDTLSGVIFDPEGERPARVGEYDGERMEWKVLRVIWPSGA